MKLLPLLSSLLILTRSLNAETFYGTTSSTNRLIVPLGQVALFDGAYGTQNGEGFSLGSITTDVQTNSFVTFVKKNNQPAIAGPAELVITNSALIVLSRIASTNVVTRIFNSPFKSTNLVVSVPASKRIRLFQPIAEVWSLWAGNNVPQFYIGDQISQPRGPIVEMDGPISIWVTQNGAFGGTLVSYILIDQTAIQGPAAALETSAQRTVWIDRSSNLTNWIPSALLHPEESGAEFYRLRIQK